MKLYHGSDVIVDKPIIIAADRPLDFGGGFYLTSDKEQAQKWARRVMFRNNSSVCYVTTFDFDLEHVDKELKLLRFDGATRDWLEFVCANRSGKVLGRDYDIVIGPVADDRVYSVVVRFENGEYELDEALKRLKVETLSDQVLFHTEKALKHLRFVKWEEIR